MEPPPTPPVEEAGVSVEKKLLTRKSSGSISSPPSVTGSPRHHRSPRRAASERRRSRHHHSHHHHTTHHERKGSLYSPSTSHHSVDGRRTSRVADRRVSHAAHAPGEVPNLPSRTNSISEHRKLSATDSSSLPPPQRKQSERQTSNGPYMSPGLNMAGGYRTPGAEILIASLIIVVGLVALIVWFSTGQKIWMIVGSVCSALGGMFMILGCCWYCATVKEEKPPDESTELRVITNEEIRAKLLHQHSSSVKNGQGPQNV